MLYFSEQQLSKLLRFLHIYKCYKIDLLHYTHTKMSSSEALMVVFWLIGSSFFLLGTSIRLADDQDHRNEEDLVSAACNIVHFTLIYAYHR